MTKKRYITEEGSLVITPSDLEVIKEIRKLDKHVDIPIMKYKGHTTNFIDFTKALDLKYDLQNQAIIKKEKLEKVI